jgi:hypothetical protein
MRFKNIYSVVFIFLLLDNCLHSQTNLNEDNGKYSNIVRKFDFLSQGNHYPLTVVLSPYGYWQHGKVIMGHNRYDNIEFMRNTTFGWGINGLMVETPRSYTYDTIAVDTITSMFNTIMCFNDSPKLPINPSDNDKLINLSDSNLYAYLSKEFKYTYLLRNTSFDDIIDSEVIRIVYATNSFPYKTSFDLVSLVILPDSIKMASASINTINLLNVKVKENGSVFLRTKDYKRLIKRIRKTIFNEEVDCNQCNQEPFDQFDFIVDYKNNQFHSSYFLCDNLHLKNRRQQMIIDYLLGLKSTLVHLNKKYFPVCEDL